MAREKVLFSLLRAIGMSLSIVIVVQNVPLHQKLRQHPLPPDWPHRSQIYFTQLFSFVIVSANPNFINLPSEELYLANWLEVRLHSNMVVFQYISGHLCCKKT